MNDRELRAAIIRTAQAMLQVDLTHGTSGNVSARALGGFLVTPSGLPYDTLATDDIVFVGSDLSVSVGQLRPSAEWRFHGAIYAERSDVGAIVHTHSPYATALACTRQGIPPFHYMVAVAGGDNVRCAPYAPFGSAELAERVLEALRGRKACLLANHGQVALGGSLEAAFNMAVEVEQLARQLVVARQAGVPALLSKDEMDEALARFSDYGQQEGR
jgi:L-fuculose-phosphate aldolase